MNCSLMITDSTIINIQNTKSYSLSLRRKLAELAKLYKEGRWRRRDTDIKAFSLGKKKKEKKATCFVRSLCPVRY